MVNPVPGKTVTTPYRKTGSHWKACGWHTGQDYAAPTGTQVVAARSGRVVHTSYGSAFGPYQFAIVCPDGTEDFYAHTTSRPSSGKQVNAGDPVARVGSLGNATGPHLHFERHKRAGSWNCSNMDDPMKSHNEGGGSVASISKGKVFLSKLHDGQKDSDSVKRLQSVLNGISLTGGQNLPITGNYGDMTRAEVAKWQSQKATDKSVTNGSKMTAAQGTQIFTGTGHTFLDDLTIVEPEPETPDEPESIETGFGLWKWYSGKPSGTLTVQPDGNWHKIGLKEPASGIKAESSEHRLLYLRLEFTSTRTADRVVETKFVRANGDATAYDSEEFGTTKDSYPYQNVHFEDGDGAGGEWWVKVTGGKDPMKITTRYAKQHTMYEEK